VHVIHNGIDLNQYRKVDSTGALKRYGIDPARPYLLFVGRITRPERVPASGARNPIHGSRFPDRAVCSRARHAATGEEMRIAVERAEAQRPGIIWINEMVDQQTACELYSQAAVFVCPSIYEPFGIINLEAMACETRCGQCCWRNQGSRR
jgi:Glycosyltransferase